LTVPNQNAPQLTLSKTQIDFGATSAQQQFTINNSGTGALTFTIADDMSWLTINPASGSTNATPVIITATINRSGLAIGNNYAGQISVTSNGGSGTVGVTMSVTSAALPAVTLQALNVTETGCQLAWSEVATPTEFSAYKVYGSSSANVSESDQLLSTITSYTTKTLNVTGSAGTTQYYAVYVYNKSGIGTRSNVVSVAYPEALKSWTLTLDGSQNNYYFHDGDIASFDDNHAFACGFKVVSGGNVGIILRWDPSISGQGIHYPQG